MVVVSLSARTHVIQLPSLDITHLKPNGGGVIVCQDTHVIQLPSVDIHMTLNGDGVIVCQDTHIIQLPSVDIIHDTEWWWCHCLPGDTCHTAPSCRHDTHDTEWWWYHCLLGYTCHTAPFCRHYTHDVECWCHCLPGYTIVVSLSAMIHMSYSSLL